MYKKFLCLCVLYLASVDCKKAIPSFVKVCRRSDPDLDGCIKTSILGIQPHLGNGIPEMRIPPFNPMKVNKLVVNNGAAVFTGEDLDLGLFDQFELIDFHLNWKKCYAKLEAHLPKMYISGNYKLEGSLLAFEVNGKGIVNANYTDIHLTPEMNCIVLRRKGREYLKFTNINLGLSIDNANATFTGLLEGEEENRSLNRIINQNIKAVIAAFESVFAKALGEVILAQIQAGFDAYSLDDILPE